MLRSRSLAVLLAALLLVGAAPVAATAQELAEAVLAVEGGGEGEPLPGPEPSLEHTFAPEEYEAPWTWWMSVILLAVTVLAIGGAALGFWLLVPRDRETAGRR